MSLLTRLNTSSFLVDFCLSLVSFNNAAILFLASESIIICSEGALVLLEEATPTYLMSPGTRFCQCPLTIDVGN